MRLRKPFRIRTYRECPLCPKRSRRKWIYNKHKSWPEFELAVWFSSFGMHFHLGAVIAGYAADVALPLNSAPAIIEYDSKRYHQTTEQEAKDREKTRAWEAEGWQVIRIREGLERLGADDVVINRPLATSSDRVNRNSLNTILDALIVPLNKDFWRPGGPGQKWADSERLRLRANATRRRR